MTKVDIPANGDHPFVDHLCEPHDCYDIYLNSPNELKLASLIPYENQWYLVYVYWYDKLSMFKFNTSENVYIVSEEYARHAINTRPANLNELRPRFEKPNDMDDDAE